MLVLVDGDILQLMEMPERSPDPEWVVADTTQMSIMEFDMPLNEISRQLVEMEPETRIGRSILVFRLPEP